MQTEFRKAVLPDELRNLVAFDHKVFQAHPADWFHHEDWLEFQSWWMMTGGRKIGCCAFKHHADLEEDRKGSLYIASTGILPRFRSQGFGTLLKSWQICYARQHGFTRIVTNSRKSNRLMIQLNKKFGFKSVRTIRKYYENPTEHAVVMELKLY